MCDLGGVYKTTVIFSRLKTQWYITNAALQGVEQFAGFHIEKQIINVTKCHIIENVMEENEQGRRPSTYGKFVDRQSTEDSN